MTLEDELRLTLREEAARPAVRPDLVEQVRVGVRRDRRRRIATAGAAALLAAAVAVPVLLAARPQATVEQAAPGTTALPGAVPAPGTMPVTPSQAPGPSGQAWERARLDLPTFPLTPGWVPGGVGPRRVDRMGPSLLLRYDDRRGGVLSAELGPEPGSWEVEGEEDHRSTVGAAPATVRTSRTFDGAAPGDRYVGVRWQRPDGQWVLVLSFGARTEAEVLRFARSLRPAPVPASPAHFELTAVPPGLTLSYLSADFVCLTPPPVTRETMQQGLCVGVATVEEPAQGVRLTVAGRPATFTSPSELRVELGAGRALTVSVDPDAMDLSSDDLVRVAAGVRIAR